MELRIISNPEQEINIHSCKKSDVLDIKMTELLYVKNNDI